MNVAAYLDRIGYGGPTDATPQTLIAIHRAHMLTVPFENLDISLGRRIVCDESSFLNKIVERRRGGFCYELNGAFAALLRGLGFTVTLLSARVPGEDGGESPEFDHLALCVVLDELWLADVGFGDSFLDPLPLRPGVETSQDGGKFRITENAGLLRTEKAEPDGNWKSLYSFTLAPRRLEEFAPRCLYHQTSPQSHFTQKKICTLAKPDGRITLADMNLIVTRNGRRAERRLGSEEEWRTTLKADFGVIL